MSSKTVTECQSCGHGTLNPILSLGWLPPVNTMWKIGTVPTEEQRYPTQLLFCPACKLVQLGIIVDPKIVFLQDYTYTSGTTKILRDNFADLAKECLEFGFLKQNDLIVDVGSNDGTLLRAFLDLTEGKERCRVQGVEPTNARLIAQENHIPTLPAYWDRIAVEDVLKWRGKAKIVTACNVFAHIPDPNEAVKNVLDVLDEDGVFITESHYLLELLEGIQYDAIYHEHIRFYSFTSLKNLLERHGLEIVYAKQISTHGGSIRVYAMRQDECVEIEGNGIDELLEWEENPPPFDKFCWNVVVSKLELLEWFANTNDTDRIVGVGCPSRAVTLINYVGLDESLLECVVEIEGSKKIGHYVPGTLIPILDESVLFVEPQPQYALLLSWHISEELVPKLKAKGFRGKFVIPLPKLKVI